MTNTSFWDKAAPKYAKDPITDMAGYIRSRDRMRDILQPHHRVLELGCGTGSTALELAGGVDRYVGTDISPQMIAIAQSKQGDDTPQQLSFRVEDAGTLQAGAQDVIVALNLLHLLPDLEDVLERMFLALPCGGLLITKTTLLGDGAWYLRWIIPLMQAVGKAPFVRNLGEGELRGLLRGAGFTVRESLIQDGIAPRMFVVACKP